MRKWRTRAVVILFWLAVWQIAAVLVCNDIILAGPVQVIQAFVQHITQAEFVKIVMCSFARIGAGFVAAFFCGVLLGAAAYRFLLVHELLEPVVCALKSIPVASFVVLLLIWFGSAGLSFFISFLIVFPNVYVNTIAGLKSVDIKLLEMARVFDIRGMNRFLYLYRPALMPYLDSCLKVSLGMAWKSGVAAEIIGLPSNSLGERLYFSKVSLDTAGLFAWTLMIILLSFLFERAVFTLFKSCREWKPRPVLQRGGVCSKEEQTPIRLSHIGVSFGEQHIFCDYCMTFETGGKYLLTAPSGAGKTTLFRVIAGLIDADSGTVTGAPACAGMVFQEDRLCEDYDAVCNIMLGMGKNMAFCLNKEGNIANMIEQEAAHILPKDCLHKPVSELSGGMRRRVALLRAVLSDSRLLLLDEPFSGLDEENRILCARYIMDRLDGRTLIVATHSKEEAGMINGVELQGIFKNI